MATFSAGRFGPGSVRRECGAVVSTTDPPDEPFWGEPVDCVCTRPRGHSGDHVDDWHDVRWGGDGDAAPRRFVPGSL